MRPILFMILFTTHIMSYSQDIPVFRSLRYEEDYSFLQQDTSANWYRRMKFTSLSKDRKTYLSYGGDVRFQYFFTKNEGWGDAPEDKDGYTLARFLVYADLHAGKNFRTFVQLQTSLAGSRIAPGPVDDNPLDLHQAFVDIKTKPSTATSFTIRLGRQEFLYGSQRLISVREGPNNRQSFDAVRSLLTTGNYKVDFFYSHYVAAKKGIFDDRFNRNTKLWGAYIVRNKLPVFSNIDIYYLGLWKRQAVFDDGSGKELRHSIGARIWDSKEDWNYDIEGLYQLGKFAGKNISAWTASISTSYTFSQSKLKPEIGLKTELISGDRHYDDNKLQTFNPLFPRGAYFGLAALIGPANLIDFHPSVALSVTKKLELGFDYDIFWRYSRHDGLYGVNGSLIYSGKNIVSDYIGDQPAVNLTYTPNNFLSFTTELTWFDAGSFLKSAGAGKDILFTGITTQLKF
jgi:Alginate export